MEASAFEHMLQERTDYAERVLREHLPKEEGLQRPIMEAMNYSLLAGGKRLRPILMYETYRMCGGKAGNAIEHFMAAIEMIHTYSLIHDDLPAMDNDCYRRGRETTWYVYGEALGILAGDGLLNYAFETALLALEECHSPEGAAQGEHIARMERAAAALSVLAGKAGIHGMIGGQVVDVMAEEESAGAGYEDIAHGPVGTEGAGRAADTGDRLLFIHTHKTAALIEASMTIGAILAGASAGEVEAIGKCARNIGIAFQIQDDILDVTGDSGELGKPTGSDAQNGKQTYVTWKGLEGARADVETLSREAASLLDGFPGGNDFLKQLILTLIYRRK